jgi:CRP-like cAMP-binding protein
VYDKLKTYCRSLIPLADEELQLIDVYFETKSLKKKELLLEDGKICNFVGFIAEGSVRHFYLKDGVEKTCDLSFEYAWVTDFQSFTSRTPAIMNLQAMAATVIFLIRKEKLDHLYKVCPKYETFGRLMAEQVAQRATAIAMSLSADKPEERFKKLFHDQPDLFQRIPQKYIANFLGVGPESLSRIRNRIITKLKS